MKKSLLTSSVLSLTLGLGSCTGVVDVGPGIPGANDTASPEIDEATELTGFIACKDEVIPFGMPSASSVEGDDQSRRKNVIRTSCEIRSLLDQGVEVDAASASISSVGCADILASAAERTRVELSDKKIDIQLAVYFPEFADLMPETCTLDISAADANGKQLAVGKGKIQIIKATKERRLSLLAPREVEVIGETSGRHDEEGGPDTNMQSLFQLSESSPDQRYNHDLSDHTEEYECSHDLTADTTDDAARTYADVCDEIGISVTGRNGIVSVNKLTAQGALDAAGALIKEYGIRFITAETADGYGLTSREVKFTVRSAAATPVLTKSGSDLSCTLAADANEQTERVFRIEARDHQIKDYETVSNTSSYTMVAGDELKQIRCVVVADKSAAGLSSSTQLNSRAYTEIDSSIIDEMLVKNYDASASSDDDVTKKRKALAVMKTRGGETDIEYPMDPRNNTLQGHSDPASLATQLPGPGGVLDAVATVPQAEAINLGNNLFIDPSIATRGTALNHGNYGEADVSMRGTWSCGTCHNVEYAYGPTRPISIGAGGVDFADNRLPDPALSLTSSHDIDAPPVRSPMIANLSANGGAMFHDQRAGLRRDCLEGAVLASWPADGLSPYTGYYSEGSRLLDDGLESSETGTISDPQTRNSAWGAERKCGNSQNVEAVVEMVEAGAEMQKYNLLGFEGVETQAIAALAEHRFSAVGNVVDKDATGGIDLATWQQLRAQAIYTQEIEGAFSTTAFEQMINEPAGSLLVGCNKDPKSGHFAVNGYAVQEINGVQVLGVEAVAYGGGSYFDPVLEFSASGDLVAPAVDQEAGQHPYNRVALCTVAELMACDSSEPAFTNTCPLGYVVTDAPGNVAEITMDYHDGSSGAVTDTKAFPLVKPLKVVNGEPVVIDLKMRGDKASGLTEHGCRPEDEAAVGTESCTKDPLVDETVDQFKKRVKLALIIANWERMVVTEEAPFQPYLVELDKLLLDQQPHLEKDLDHKAKQGALVFLKSCAGCHNGPDLGGDVSVASNWGLADAHEFFAEQADVPHLLAEGSRTMQGRFKATGVEADRYKKKVPTLYNLQEHIGLGHGSSIDSIKQMVAYKVKVLNDKSKRQKTDAELAAAGVSTATYEASMVDIGDGLAQAPQSMADLTDEQVDLVSYFIKTALHDAGMDRFSNPIANANPESERGTLTDEDGNVLVDDGSRLVPNPRVCANNDDSQSRYTLAGADAFGCDGDRQEYQ